MIEVEGLTKKFGDKIAVDGLAFRVVPGVVTGFLGPNGAGKSTTMRVIAGLDAPDAGRATVVGQRYRDLRAPLCTLGALLDAKSAHPGRSARGHLLALARTHGLSARRVDEVLALTGLAEVAGRRAGSFSLGMSQRLGIAAALLGDPAVVMLDEPVNGLDPDGVLWIRTLLIGLAAEGRTVLVSSHLLSEMAQTATNLIVIGRGRLLADTTVEKFVADSTTPSVTVVTDEPGRLRIALAGPEVEVTGGVEPERLIVQGLTARAIGRVAADHRIAVFELTTSTPSLEKAFMDLTSDHVEFASADRSAS